MRHESVGLVGGGRPAAGPRHAAVGEERHFHRQRTRHALRHAEGAQQREPQLDIADEHPAADPATGLVAPKLDVSWTNAADVVPSVRVCASAVSFLSSDNTSPVINENTVLCTIRSNDTCVTPPWNSTRWARLNG